MSNADACKGDHPLARRLRIAVFNRTFAPTGGGAERYAIALVEQLAARHDIHVFAQQIEHRWPGVTYHLVSMPLRKPRWVNQLWYATVTWWATRTGFDVVHSHENTWHGNVHTVHVLPVWHNLFVGRVGLRRVLRWLNVLTSPRLLTYLVLEWQRFALPGIAVSAKSDSNAARRRIMVTSDSLAAVMSKTFPRSASALQVLVPGVDLPTLPPSAAQRLAARASLGLPKVGPCLLLVGNDFRKKGLGCMLKALASLPQDVVLAVVGSLQQKALFHTEADDLGLQGRVFFLGQLNDVAPAYQAADLLVHPTLEDTFAMVVLEAMAHSLPVVVSGPAFCGISGLLQDNVNALLLPDPRDANALAQKIQQVLGDSVLRQSLSHQAREFAQHHAWPEKARAQESVYLGVALKPPA